MAILTAAAMAQAETPAEAQGRALARRVAAKMGIHKPVKSMRATFQQGEGSNATQIEATIVFPDHMRVEVHSPRGQVTVVFTPQDAFSVTADGALHDVPPLAREEGLEQILRDPIYLCAHVNDPAVKFTAAGEERLGAVQTKLVDVSAGGAVMRWDVDPRTARILRETYKTVTPQGAAPAATLLSQWRTMGGLELPARHENYQNGKLVSVVMETALQLNPIVDPAAFRRPAAKR